VNSLDSDRIISNSIILTCVVLHAIVMTNHTKALGVIKSRTLVGLEVHAPRLGSTTGSEFGEEVEGDEGGLSARRHASSASLPGPGVVNALTSGDAGKEEDQSNEEHCRLFVDLNS
jgi:hypothetical protein